MMALAGVELENARFRVRRADHLHVVYYTPVTLFKCYRIGSIKVINNAGSLGSSAMLVFL